MLRKKKGQSTLEYALIIVVIVAALVIINHYMKQGFLGRLKESTDQIGKQFDPRGTYTYAWHSKGDGNTTTQEYREGGNSAEGEATWSAVTQSERTTRDDYEDWVMNGTLTGQHGFNGTP
jgi:hypothetical protein